MLFILHENHICPGGYVLIILETQKVMGVADLEIISDLFV